MAAVAGIRPAGRFRGGLSPGAGEQSVTWKLRVRPVVEVVLRPLQAQRVHTTLNWAAWAPFALGWPKLPICPAGRVTMPATGSMWKSSLIKPSGTAYRTGERLGQQRMALQAWSSAHIAGTLGGVIKHGPDAR